MKTTDALKIMDHEFGSDPQWQIGLAEERTRVLAARAIYDAREAAGLTQQALAKLVGTSQSTIARLEDADYDGHTLKLLNRIAAALHQQLEVKFVPIGAAA